MDTSLLARLFLAHLLGDFALQPDRWVAHRRARHFRSPFLYLHAAVHFALALLATGGSGGWIMALIIAAGHILLDGTKAALRLEGVRAFVADQAGHIIILIGCWMQHKMEVKWRDAFTALLTDTDVLWPLCGYGAAVFLFPKLIALATSQ